MPTTRLHVLLVEDNPGDARLIHESLGDPATSIFDVEFCDRLAPALDRLAQGGIDALLLDLSLPDSSGQDTFRRAYAQAPHIPIIILTGLGDETVAIKMVEDGAQDYVAKNELTGSILGRCIRYAIARERIDQQVRRFNEELEQRVRQRTAELEAANRELEAFSYSVSHDLRAPLRHIDGFSRLLQESCGAQLSPESEKHISRICNAVAHMSRIIDDLLRLARVGRTPLQIRPVPLPDLVAEIRNEFAAETADRRIEWRISPLPTVPCDSGLMKQVLQNLIGNSLKYSRPRPVAVIEIGQTIAGGTPAFFIRDNGVGFDMKYASKLFGAFQRLHTDAEFEGTGIGLATVRRIIERHNGRIWAESEPDRGSTFLFTLEPAADAFLVRLAPAESAPAEPVANLP